jgi:hypothetical protein
MQYEDLNSQGRDLKISHRIKRKCKTKSRHGPEEKLDASRRRYQGSEVENVTELLQSQSYDDHDHGISNLAILQDHNLVQKDEATELAKVLLFRSSASCEMGSRPQNALEDFVNDLEGICPALSVIVHFMMTHFQRWQMLWSCL